MHIDFKSVVAANFRSYRDFSLDLEFPGTTFVQGTIEGGSETLESNGAGKSSPFNAISWALFGKFLHVSGSVVSGDQVIRRNSEGGCSVHVDLHVNEDDIRIIRYRGHSRFANKVLVFVNGAEKTLASNLKTQQYIEDLVGVSFELFTNLVYVSETSMKGSFAFESDAQRKKILVSALPQFQRFGDARVKVKDSLNQHITFAEKLQIQCEALEEALNELNNESLTHTDVGSMRTRITELEETVKQGTARIEEYKSQREQIKQAGLFKYYEDLIDEAQKERRAIEEKIQSFDLPKISAELAFYKGEIEKWKNLPPTCPMCDQPVDEEHKSRHIRALKAEGIIRLQKKDNIETVIQNLKVGINKTILDEREANKKGQEVQQLLWTLDNSIRSEQTVIKSHEENVQQLRALLRTLESRQFELEKRKIALTDKISTLRTLTNTTRTFENSLQLWFDGFGPKGVLSMALAEIIDLLGDKAGKWLTRLWHEGASMTFSLIGDDLSKIEAKLFLNLQDVDLLSLSSGETRRLCLAICFGLREALQTLTGWFSNLLVLDEVFDGLDSIGRLRVLSELKSMAETSIFIISQFPQLSQDIDRVINVRFNNNVSHLEVSNING